MADVNISANMNLPIPIVGVDPGPDWASNLNASFTLIDQHNHSAGQGVQIGTAGINIDGDFTQNSNNLTFVRSTRYVSQPGPISDPADLSSVYVSGGNLYYNNSGGTAVQITNGGSIVGASGTITGLVSPASATFVSLSSTFVWQSGVNIPANMDFGGAILRNISTNSKGLTLSPPSAMGADYTLTLPSIPASQSFLAIDTSGNISGFAATSAGITGSMIAGATITRANLATGAIGNDTFNAQISDYSVASTDDYLSGSASGGSFTFTLFGAIANSGRKLKFLKTDSSNNAITITDGGSYSTTLNTQGESLEVESNGTNWSTINRYIRSQWATTGTVNITATTTSPTKGTTTVDQVVWRRVGTNAEIRYQYEQTGAGSAGSGDYLFQIPAAIGIIDTTFITPFTTVPGAQILSNCVGYGRQGQSGGGSGPNNAVVYDTTHVRLIYLDPTTNGYINSANYNLGLTSVVYFFNISVPIVGWKQ